MKIASGFLREGVAKRISNAQFPSYVLREVVFVPDRFSKKVSTMLPNHISATRTYLLQLFFLPVLLFTVGLASAETPYSETEVEDYADLNDLVHMRGAEVRSGFSVKSDLGLPQPDFYMIGAPNTKALFLNRRNLEIDEPNDVRKFIVGGTPVKLGNSVVLFEKEIGGGQVARWVLFSDPQVVLQPTCGFVPFPPPGNVTGQCGKIYAKPLSFFVDTFNTSHTTPIDIQPLEPASGLPAVRPRLGQRMKLLSFGGKDFLLATDDIASELHAFEITGVTQSNITLTHRSVIRQTSAGFGQGFGDSSLEILDGVTIGGEQVIAVGARTATCGQALRGGVYFFKLNPTTGVLSTALTPVCGLASSSDFGNALAWMPDFSGGPVLAIGAPRNRPDRSGSLYLLPWNGSAFNTSGLASSELNLENLENGMPVAPQIDDRCFWSIAPLYNGSIDENRDLLQFGCVNRNGGQLKEGAVGTVDLVERAIVGFRNASDIQVTDLVDLQYGYSVQREDIDGDGNDLMISWSSQVGQGQALPGKFTVDTLDQPNGGGGTVAVGGTASNSLCGALSVPYQEGISNYQNPDEDYPQQSDVLFSPITLKFSGPVIASGQDDFFHATYAGDGYAFPILRDWASFPEVSKLSEIPSKTLLLVEPEVRTFVGNAGFTSYGYTGKPECGRYINLSQSYKTSISAPWHSMGDGVSQLYYRWYRFGYGRSLDILDANGGFPNFWNEANGPSTEFGAPLPDTSSGIYQVGHELVGQAMASYFRRKWVKSVLNHGGCADPYKYGSPSSPTNYADNDCLCDQTWRVTPTRVLGRDGGSTRPACVPCQNPYDKQCWEPLNLTVFSDQFR